MMLLSTTGRESTIACQDSVESFISSAGINPATPLLSDLIAHMLAALLFFDSWALYCNAEASPCLLSGCSS
jgi:hypothetical protein